MGTAPPSFDMGVMARIQQALDLIERSAAFEGDGDLAAAHLVLSDLSRYLCEASATQAIQSARQSGKTLY
jgi:hypothetical protein